MSLVILGLGNDLLGDDGVGLLTVDRLEGRFGPDVALRRSEQSGLYLLESLLGYDDAILIDTVPGDRPGRVRELEEREIEPLRVPSAHYAGLPEVLAVARLAGLAMPRRLRIFAVEIEASQMIGTGPREVVMAAVPTLVDRTVAAARAWGYEARGTEPEAQGACTSTD